MKTTTILYFETNSEIYESTYNGLVTANIDDIFRQKILLISDNKKKNKFVSIFGKVVNQYNELSVIDGDTQQVRVINLIVDNKSNELIERTKADLNKEEPAPKPSKPKK